MRHYGGVSGWNTKQSEAGSLIATGPFLSAFLQSSFEIIMLYGEENLQSQITDLMGLKSCFCVTLPHTDARTFILLMIRALRFLLFYSYKVFQTLRIYLDRTSLDSSGTPEVKGH